MIIDHKELLKLIEEEDIDAEFVIIKLLDGTKIISKMYDVLGSDTPYVIIKDAYIMSYDESLGWNFSSYAEYSDDRFILFNIQQAYSFYNASLDFVDLYNEIVTEIHSEEAEEENTLETPVEKTNIVHLTKLRPSKKD